MGSGEASHVGDRVQSTYPSCQGSGISPHGKYSRLRKRDGTVILWNLKYGEIIGRPLRTNRGEVYSVAFSTDGQHLLSAHESGHVCIWNLSSKRLITLAKGLANRELSPSEHERYLGAK